MITLIACVDSNMGLGMDDKLLIHLPKDLQHFKQTTMGHICVFGRKTYEALPKKPLPQRKNVILTSDKVLSYTSCKTVNSIDAILDMSKTHHVYICGGGNVYEQFMPHADELIVTHLDASFEADTFFPCIDDETWIPYSFEQIEDKVSFEIVKYNVKQKSCN